MEATQAQPVARAPWHLWVVGIVSLLWNAIGATDYVMTQMRVESYMSGFTKEQLDYFYGFPAWVIAAWAIAVWSSALGSLVLLFRSALSIPLFSAALLGMVATSFHNFVLTNGVAIMGIGGAAFSAFVFVVGALLFYYAMAMRRAGVLR